MQQNYIKYNAETPPKISKSFTGKERDSETGFSYFGARYYDSDLMTGWLSVDPMADKYPSLSPYAYCAWNPVKLVDPDGRTQIPLKKKYKNWTFRVDSWFGRRNIETEEPRASTFHKGLDFNYTGGGNTDYGSPILTTHEGTATIDNDPNGAEGRTVIITSPDGSFRTKYFHLSKINISDGDYVFESDVIGEMGGSAYGKELGRTSHLHYEIQIKDGDNWVSINPSRTKKNNLEDLYDPQTWIFPEDRKGYIPPQLRRINKEYIIDNTRVEIKIVEPINN